MSFSLVYIFGRFFFRIGSFLHHWYVHGTRAIWHAAVGQLEALDRTFAVKVTLRHFFEPLYKDYSPVGRILGIVFRTFRILIGAALYLVVFSVYGLAYLVWIAIPVLLIADTARFFFL
jgi:hypothetical protein